MELPAMTRTLLAAKKTKGLTFADLGAVVDRDEVWVAALCYRQATASPEEAQKFVAALGLAPEMAQELSEFPTKGLGPVVPTDPLIYRLYEILQVYGLPLKAVIQERSCSQSVDHRIETGVPNS